MYSKGFKCLGPHYFVGLDCHFIFYFTNNKAMLFEQNSYSKPLWDTVLLFFKESAEIQGTIQENNLRLLIDPSSDYLTQFYLFKGLYTLPLVETLVGF